ncbi:RNA polymerase sigma factor [Salipaludibacillus daqingensis]|uniref:RNA polymerase sigma factor n=1 Tax=Salipaludibacillus daqingensis TaxID=3041001 RepID=UPI0024764F0D|nr:RNA polymerase sigma factor [Salipaludibacillus daqingensis]
MDEIESWFHNYADDIFNYLSYYTGTRDVDDLVQDTFIKAIRFQHQFKGESSEKTWLISIARRTALDHFKKQGKWLPWKDSLSQKNKLTSVSSEEVLLENEEKKELLDHIYQLPSKKQDVVLLRGIMECTSQETAQILGWRENKVNVTLHRALKDLKEAYSISERSYYDV